MLIATMIGMLSYGIYLDVLSAQLAPQKVFSEVAGGCRILTVDHSERKNGPNKIFDRYTYDFSEVANGDKFQSITEEIRRDRANLDVPTPGSFTVGQNVTCWQPAGVEGVPSLERFYTCGNPECVRVLSPYDQHAYLQTVGFYLTIFGAVAGVIGITATAVLVYFYRACKQEQMQSKIYVEPENKKGYGVFV